MIEKKEKKKNGRKMKGTLDTVIERRNLKK